MVAKVETHPDGGFLVPEEFWPELEHAVDCWDRTKSPSRWRRLQCALGRHVLCERHGRCICCVRPRRRGIWWYLRRQYRVAALILLLGFVAGCDANSRRFPPYYRSVLVMPRDTDPGPAYVPEEPMQLGAQDEAWLWGVGDEGPKRP